MKSSRRVTRITLEFEHPVTPGDLEQAYCRLLEEVGQ